MLIIIIAALVAGVVQDDRGVVGQAAHIVANLVTPLLWGPTHVVAREVVREHDVVVEEDAQLVAGVVEGLPAYVHT